MCNTRVCGTTRVRGTTRVCAGTPTAARPCSPNDVLKYDRRGGQGRPAPPVRSRGHPAPGQRQCCGRPVLSRPRLLWSFLHLGDGPGAAGSRGTAECGRRQAAPAQDTRASQQSCCRPPGSARLCPALRGSARLCASGRGQDKAGGPPPPMPCTPPSGASFPRVQLHPEPVYGLGARFHSPFPLWGNPATSGKTGPGDFSGKARASDTSGWNLRSARPSDETWRRVQVFDGLIVELPSSSPAVPTGLSASLTFYYSLNISQSPS